MVFKGSKIERAIAVFSLLVLSCSSQISLVILFSSVGTTMATTTTTPGPIPQTTTTTTTNPGTTTLGTLATTTLPQTTTTTTTPGPIPQTTTTTTTPGPIPQTTTTTTTNPGTTTQGTLATTTLPQTTTTTTTPGPIPQTTTTTTTPGPIPQTTTTTPGTTTQGTLATTTLPQTTTTTTTPGTTTQGTLATTAIANTQCFTTRRLDDQHAGVDTGNLRAARSRNLNGWFPCGSNTHCVKDRATCSIDTNDIGTCTCLDGYGGIECRPVNECEIDFPCPGGSLCVDMFPPMRFKCVCKNGFTPFLPNELPNDPGVPLSYRPIQCIDKLECDADESPCHQDASCTNTIGGFECLCNQGFQGNGITDCEAEEVAAVTDAAPADGFCMIDTDCTGSNMQCVDSQCACRPGYAQVGANCQNEVHCDKGGFNNDCHARATCTEEDGFPGFSCKCIDGWEDAFDGANGKSCKDIPPVTEAPPEPFTEAATDGPGVGPRPNRPTVFPPTCLGDGAPCGAASDCCGGGCA